MATKPYRTKMWLRACLHSLTSLSFLLTIANSTIDMNAAELQYIADNLTPEECRRLVASLHFKSFQEPNSLDQAERRVPTDLSCIQLLHHWNSEPGEGKGETHEALGHRLKQMGKGELADWLGRVVFHEEVVDLNRSLESGLKDLATDETTELAVVGPTLAPLVQNTDATEWSSMDAVLYAGLVGLILTFLVFGARFAYVGICRWRRRRGKKKVKFGKSSNYDLLEPMTSEDESEDKFDVRTVTKNSGTMIEKPMTETYDS